METKQFRKEEKCVHVDISVSKVLIRNERNALTRPTIQQSRKQILYIKKKKKFTEPNLCYSLNYNFTVMKICIIV